MLFIEKRSGYKVYYNKNNESIVSPLSRFIPMIYMYIYPAILTFQWNQGSFLSVLIITHRKL